MRLIFFIILLSSSLFCHTLILNLIDNEDGTIQIVGVFSTGQNAAGALVKVKSLNTEKILFEQRLPDESEINYKIPNEPYEVILDGGPSHKIAKKGIAPIGGFKNIIKTKINKKVKKAEKTSFTLPILWGLCVVLLALILFFWIKNTRIIMQLLKNRV